MLVEGTMLSGLLDGTSPLQAFLKPPGFCPRLLVIQV